MSSYLTLQKMHELVSESEKVNISELVQKQAIQHVSTDSRKIQLDDFFIAICGERFDGNQFLSEVFKKGAMAALASNQECIPANQPVLLVKDTLKALQEIAMKWRLEADPLLVVVTGSNGKTTVKEMIASIFKEAVGASHVLATPGNLNNEIGMPLTLLGLNKEHQLAVIEIGMNHPGETKFLANIASPNISLINNAQREHQEFMQSVEAVAAEHGDAISALPADGIAVFPADSQYSDLWKNLCQSRTYFDFELRNDGQATVGRVHGNWLANGRLQIHLPQNKNEKETTIEVHLSTLGDHNAKNAIAAAAVSWAANIKSELIVAGLEKFQPVAGRIRSHELPGFGKEARVIDDTYNANPDSVIAAIDVLAKLPGTRWLVLGDMGEVGDKGDVFHHEIGEYAKRMGIEHLYATGTLSKYAVQAFNHHSGAMHFDEPKALLKKLKSELQIIKTKAPSSAVSILVKGSRFTKMERIVNCLLKEESLCF
jgi:UDP-N-acetylmuramoyl-tripeptide--D-alanyl-D-alanine ligase